MLMVEVALIPWSVFNNQLSLAEKLDPIEEQISDKKENQRTNSRN